MRLYCLGGAQLEHVCDDYIVASSVVIHGPHSHFDTLQQLEKDTRKMVELANTLLEITTGNKEEESTENLVTITFLIQYQKVMLIPLSHRGGI